MAWALICPFAGQDKLVMQDSNENPVGLDLRPKKRWFGERVAMIHDHGVAADLMRMGWKDASGLPTDDRYLDTDVDEPDWVGGMVRAYGRMKPEDQAAFLEKIRAAKVGCRPAPKPTGEKPEADPVEEAKKEIYDDTEVDEEEIVETWPPPETPGWLKKKKFKEIQAYCDSLEAVSIPPSAAKQTLIEIIMRHVPHVTEEEFDHVVARRDDARAGG